MQDKWPKKFYFVAFIFALILVCTFGSVFSVIEYQAYSAKYHRDMSLAREGIQYLRTATGLLEALPRNPLDLHTVQEAQRQFASALTIFVQLDNDLKSLPGVNMSIPMYGARLSAASYLLPLAIEASQAGVVVCNTLNLLISRFHDPLNTQQQDLTQADFMLIEQNFQQIKTTLKLVIDQVNHLQPSELQLDPRLSKIVAPFHKDMPTLQAWLDTTEQLLPVLPALLGIGTPTNYLIEVLDSTELRPGGGFIGNYGIVTLSGGQLTSARITDTYLLDGPFVAVGHTIPYPPAYACVTLAPAWSLRDSNLYADFPTAARYGEQNYMREGGSIPVQGVIAITPALIQHTLEITGPINVPEYHKTVASQNLNDRIHYHQLGPTSDGSSLIPSPDGLSSQRKHCVALFAEHFLARVRQLPSPALPKFVQLLVSAIYSKDLQIYFNSSEAENLLQSSHLDARIESPGGDSLFIVDANIGGNKASESLITTLDDQVTIEAQGNVVHHTTISYAWTTPGDVHGSSLYQDYARVYVPPGSMLQMQDGWEPRGTNTAFSRQVWAGFFTFYHGQTSTITLVWTEAGAAKKDGNVWHYRYLIQRQAGT